MTKKLRNLFDDLGSLQDGLQLLVDDPDNKDGGSLTEWIGFLRSCRAAVNEISYDLGSGGGGKQDQCTVRKYKLVYNYSSVELDLSGPLEKVEPMIQAEYDALRRLSDPRPDNAVPEGSWELQEPPMDCYVDDGYVAQRSPSRKYGKKPLTEGERRYATSLGMKNAWDPDVDPSQVRSWIGSHKGRR